jgi:hypothetical protein
MIVDTEHRTRVVLSVHADYPGKRVVSYTLDARDLHALLALTPKALREWLLHAYTRMPPDTHCLRGRSMSLVVFDDIERTPHGTEER